MGWAIWVGPAIVAALISSLVTIGGWAVSGRQDLRRERRRRAERVRDVQTALRSEIRSHLHFIDSEELEGEVADTAARIRRSAERHEAFTPLVPKQAEPVIYKAVIAEIHLLPVSVIDDVVLYYAQHATVSLFAEELRTDTFSNLASDRKERMYLDYGVLRRTAIGYGEAAIDALNESLRHTPTRRPDQ